MDVECPGARHNFVLEAVADVAPRKVLRSNARYTHNSGQQADYQSAARSAAHRTRMLQTGSGRMQARPRGESDPLDSLPQRLQRNTTRVQRGEWDRHGGFGPELNLNNLL